MNINTTSKRFVELPFMKRQDSTPTGKEMRLPGIGFIPNKARNHLIAMIGEFIGTFMFLFFAFAATQVANQAAAAATEGASAGGASLAQAPNAGVLLYIALAFGFSLAVNVWVFFRISGGLFNPAVTLGLALIGGITWARAGIVFIAEMLAGMAAAGVVSGLFPGEMAVSTTLNSTTSITRGLFIEMFLTAELVFTIFMLAAEKHKGTFLAPIGIGLALFVAELAGVYFTGGSLNPARSFGPCVVLGVFPSEHWIYWLGPILGTLVAVGFYRLVKMLEYETANPGQDFNEKEAENFDFDEDTARGSDIVRPIPSADGPESRSRSGTGQLSGSGDRLDSSGGRLDSNGGRLDSNGGRLDSNGGANSPRIFHDSYREAPRIEEGSPRIESGNMGGNYRPYPGA